MIFVERNSIGDKTVEDNVQRRSKKSYANPGRKRDRTDRRGAGWAQKAPSPARSRKQARQVLRGVDVDDVISYDEVAITPANVDDAATGPVWEG